MKDLQTTIIILRHSIDKINVQNFKFSKAKIFSQEIQNLLCIKFKSNFLAKTYYSDFFINLNMKKIA